MIYPDEEKVTYDYNLGGQVDHVRGYKSYGYDYVNSEFSGGNTGTARFSLYVSPYLVAGQGSKHTKHILHFRAGRKSFSEWFGISAHGESRFPSGLAFPRWAKVVSRVVWRVRESFIYKNEKIDKVGKARLWHLTQKPTKKLSSLWKCARPHS